MATRRVSSGRLTRVDQRRRSRQWRIIIAVMGGAAVIAFVIFALIYKGRTSRRPAPPPLTAETAATEPATATVPPPTATTVVGDAVRTAVINNTKVPQRFGNALAVLEQYNVSRGNVYRLEPSKPRVMYEARTAVFCRPGFEQPARDLATALGATLFPSPLDVTVICGQDVSELILEAMAKKLPAPAGAKVEVLNGCGIEGAAAKIKERLEANGYAVVAVGNAADFSLKKTRIEAAGGRDNDAAVKIASLFGVAAADVKDASYDIKVVICDDYTAAPEQP